MQNIIVWGTVSGTTTTNVKNILTSCTGKNIIYFFHNKTSATDKTFLIMSSNIFIIYFQELLIRKLMNKSLVKPHCG